MMETHLHRLTKNPDVFPAFVADIKRGYTTRVLAGMYGCSPFIVHVARERLGLKHLQCIDRLLADPVKLRAFMDDWLAEVRVRDMAEKYGFSEAQVSRMAHYLGLEPRYSHEAKPQKRKEATPRKCLGPCGKIFYSIHPAKTHRICPRCGARMGE